MFTKGALTTIAVLLALLAAAIALAVFGWNLDSEVEMSGQAYAAMILGIVFSLVVGCGLMALVFYSSRAGYDEPPHRVLEREQDRPR
jgi:fatty acid desaturase